LEIHYYSLIPILAIKNKAVRKFFVFFEGGYEIP